MIDHTFGLIKTNEMINQQYEDDCNRRGKCIGGKCHCYRKWRGINCAIPRKMCPKKCLNGGTCSDRGRYGSHQVLSTQGGFRVDASKMALLANQITI